MKLAVKYDNLDRSMFQGPGSAFFLLTGKFKRKWNIFVEKYAVELKIFGSLGCEQICIASCFRGTRLYSVHIYWSVC